MIDSCIINFIEVVVIFKLQYKSNVYIIWYIRMVSGKLYDQMSDCEFLTNCIEMVACCILQKVTLDTLDGNY